MLARAVAGFLCLLLAVAGSPATASSAQARCGQVLRVRAYDAHAYNISYTWTPTTCRAMGTVVMRIRLTSQDPLGRVSTRSATSTCRTANGRCSGRAALPHEIVDVARYVAEMSMTITSPLSDGEQVFEVRNTFQSDCRSLPSPTCTGEDRKTL